MICVVIGIHKEYLNPLLYPLCIMKVIPMMKWGIFLSELMHDQLNVIGYLSKNSSDASYQLQGLLYSDLRKWEPLLGNFQSPFWMFDNQKRTHKQNYGFKNNKYFSLPPSHLYMWCICRWISINMILWLKNNADKHI